MTSYVGLGFDPTPGEPSAVESALNQLVDAGGKLEMLMGSIESDLSLSDGWSGSSADEFHDNLDDIPRALNSGAESMGRVATALTTWAGQLADNKLQTETLDKLALELKRQLADAVEDLKRASAALESASRSDLPRAQAAFDRAAVHAVSVNYQFDEVIKQAKELERKHLAQAEATAARIAGAANSDTFEPTGKFDQVVGTVGNVLGEIGTWTGRAAFVAGLLATGPAGWTVAGALTATAAATSLAGSGAKLHAKQAGVHSFKDDSTLGILADGVLSIGGPSSAGRAALIKALRSKGPKGVLDAAKKLKGKEAWRKAYKDAIDDGNIGKAVKAYRDAGEAKTLREAAENIGKIKAEEAARRDAIDKAIEGGGHAGASAVDAADLLDRASGGDGLPDLVKVPARLPDLPAAAGEAADQFSKQVLKKIEGGR